MTIFWKILLRFISEDAFKASTRTLEKGRPVVIQTSDGKLRMVVGDGTKLPKDLNYIGESIYKSTSPTTVKVGGVEKNSILEGKSSIEILEQMLNEYQDVILNSLSSSQGAKEVGDPLSGSLTISLGISNSNNIRAYDKARIETTPEILSSQFFDPLAPPSFSLNGYVSNIIRNISLKVTIYGTENESSSRTINIPYRARMYWGSSEQTSLVDKAAVEALGSDQLASSRQGTFTLSPGYTYFVIPTLIPLSGIGFTDIDVSTGKELFGYAMNRKADIEFNNGFINVNHAVFRSDNYLNSTTKCKIT